jgi:hypothetical protein
MAWLLGGRAGGLLVTYASWRWAAAGLLAAFAVIEARSQHALLPTRLLRNRNRLGADGVTGRRHGHVRRGSGPEAADPAGYRPRRTGANIQRNVLSEDR